jgi:hypothetical protein
MAMLLNRGAADFTLYFRFLKAALMWPAREKFDLPTQ